MQVKTAASIALSLQSLPSKGHWHGPAPASDQIIKATWSGTAGRGDSKVLKIGHTEQVRLCSSDTTRKNWTSRDQILQCLFF